VAAASSRPPMRDAGPMTDERVEEAVRARR
jgi:hypothetical protein